MTEPQETSISPENELEPQSTTAGELDPAPGEPLGSRPPLEPVHTMGRRSFIGGGAAVLAAAAGMRHLQHAGYFQGGSDASPTTLQQQISTPVKAATPMASPVASPVPATPQATPVPKVSQIGKLKVVWDESPTYSASPVNGGDLSVALVGERGSDFSPAAFGTGFQVMASYLDPLLWIDEVTLEPKPWLAESWTWSDDNKEVTFKLRKDVTWHNGDPFRARDAAFSMIVYRDDLNSAVRNLFTNLDSVDDPDDYTLKVTLTRPDGNFLLNAATQLIMQRSQYNKHWTANDIGQRSLSDYEWDKKAPIGTGPWVFDQVGDDTISFKRNDDYFAGPPHTETLTLSWVVDQATRIERWNNGEADVVYPLAAGDIAAASETPGELWVVGAPNVMFGAFNFANPTRPDPGSLASLQIRQALSLLIDRETYARDVYKTFTRGDRPGTVAQPWANDSDLSIPSRNVKEANKLLDEAGAGDASNRVFPDGSPLSLTVITRNTEPIEFLSVLSGIGKNMAEAGIGWDLQPMDPAQFRDRWTTTRDYDIICYSYALYPGFTDYDLYGAPWDIRINPQGWNPGGYDNDSANDLIQQILVEPDLEAQTDLLHQLQKTVNDDLFGLWFGFPYDLALVADGVTGFMPDKYFAPWNTRQLWRTGS